MVYLTSATARTPGNAGPGSPPLQSGAEVFGRWKREIRRKRIRQVLDLAYAEVGYDMAHGQFENAAARVRYWHVVITANFGLSWWREIFPEWQWPTFEPEDLDSDLSGNREDPDEPDIFPFGDAARYTPSSIPALGGVGWSDEVEAENWLAGQ